MAEIEQASRVLDTIKTLNSTYKVADHEEWDNGVDLEVQDITTRMEQAIQVTDLPNARRAVLLLTRRDLMDLSQEGTVNLLNHLGLDNVADIVQAQRDAYSLMFDEWRSLLEEQETTARSEVQTREEDARRAQRAASDLLAAADKLQQDSSKLALDNQDLREQVAMLKARNIAMGEELKALSAARATHVASPPPPPAASSAPREPSPTTPPLAVAPSRSNGAPTTHYAPTPAAIGASPAGTPPPASSAMPCTPSGSARGSVTPSAGGRSGGAPSSPRNGRAAASPPTSSAATAPMTRELTLRQFKDLIIEIMDSKARADGRAAAAGQARTTLEAHLYSFLNQKFGLRKLVSEWLQAVLDAIDRYALVDVDVALFGKILRNDVEEEFWPQQMDYDAGLTAQLHAVLSRRNPSKGDAEVAELVKDRTEGSLPQEEWLEVLRLAADAKDVPLLASKLMARATNGAADVAQGRGAGALIKCLPFSDLRQELKLCNLRMHERALAPVVDAFRRVDHDCSGVLDEGRFGAFCKAINPAISQKEVNVLLNTMDPHNTKVITFSSCAYMLAAELSRIMSRLPS